MAASALTGRQVAITLLPGSFDLPLTSKHTLAALERGVRTRRRLIVMQLRLRLPAVPLNPRVVVCVAVCVCMHLVISGFTVVFVA